MQQAHRALIKALKKYLSAKKLQGLFQFSTIHDSNKRSENTTLVQHWYKSKESVRQTTRSRNAFWILIFRETSQYFDGYSFILLMCEMAMLCKLQQLETCKHNNPEELSWNVLMIIKKTLFACTLQYSSYVKQNGKGILNFCHTKKCFVTVFNTSQGNVWYVSILMWTDKYRK